MGCDIFDPIVFLTQRVGFHGVVSQENMLVYADSSPILLIWLCDFGGRLTVSAIVWWLNCTI